MPDGRLLTPLAVLGALLLGLMVLAVVFQRRLVYLPVRHTPPPVEAVLPGAEALTLATEDGLTLGAWYLPAMGSDGRAVLVCNGNAGTRADRAELGAALARRGYAVLLFDYRGYGGNPGQPTETGLLADARAARAALVAHPEVDPRRLVYFGESLGAAVALALAVEEPPAALVLRSPFTSLADVGRFHYPFLPVVEPLLFDRYPSLERIGQLRSPVLVVAGARDGTIPPKQSRRLYEAAPERLHREWALLPGASHNDPVFAGEGPFLDRVVRFLDAAIILPRSVD